MSEINQLSDQFFSKAIEAGATDIHLIPLGTRYDCYYRIAGALQYSSSIEERSSQKVVNHLKYTVGMDISDRRKAQSKTMFYKWNEQTFSLRISTLPTSPLESIAVRISSVSNPFPLQSLPLFQSDKRYLAKLLTYQSGLLLLTGSTGSGKTTTVYALLEELLKQKDRLLVSIEDPIERELDGMVQMQVNEQAGITFASSLKSMLRHDPDVIVIGEIRDSETAKLAMEAAVTGHLVIATLHVTNAHVTLARLMDLGIDRGFESIRAIVHQQLVTLPNKQKQIPLFTWMFNNHLQTVLNSTEGNYSASLKPVLARAWAIGVITEQQCMTLLEK